jgi:NADH-quinone oxidoreductase subunit N
MNYVPLLSPAIATATLKGPHVDFAGLSPLIALLGGAAIVLLVGLLSSKWARAQLVPALSLAVLAAALGLTIWQWNSQKSIVSGALRIDDLSLLLNIVLIAGGAATVLLGCLRAPRTRCSCSSAWSSYRSLSMCFARRACPNAASTRSVRSSRG